MNIAVALKLLKNCNDFVLVEKLLAQKSLNKFWQCIRGTLPIKDVQKFEAGYCIDLKWAVPPTFWKNKSSEKFELYTTSLSGKHYKCRDKINGTYETRKKDIIFAVQGLKIYVTSLRHI